MPISNVSDTALWVAMYRATESERPDALFSDPLARRLAGVEGERIAKEMGAGAGMAAGMAVRTRLIDDLILRAVRDEGIDLVVNLACGLDARPYRMKLPASLRWVEADFPALMDFKESRLDGAEPSCRLERCRVDLSDAAARTQFLQEKLAQSRKALVLTEGLLCYLTAEQVQALARELRGQSPIAYWVTDLFSTRMISLIRINMGKALEQGNAAIRFGARPEAFEAWGWKIRETAWIFEETRKFGRDFPASFLWRPLVSRAPRVLREFLRQAYSIVLFEAT